MALKVGRLHKALMQVGWSDTGAILGRKQEKAREKVRDTVPSTNIGTLDKYEQRRL